MLFQATHKTPVGELFLVSDEHILLGAGFKNFKDLFARMDLADQKRIDYVHASPPCGTATRAREKRVSAQLKALGASDPMQLRSPRWPAGLPSLTGLNLHKVTLANQIYDWLAKFFMLCYLRGVKWSCENPKRSFLWMMPSWQLLIQDITTCIVDYENKASRWLTN